MDNRSTIIVYIILVNYNGWKDTRDCIHSLGQMHNQNYHVIVVDNASTDDSSEILHELFYMNDKVTVIDAESNQGFAGGNNLGIRYASECGAEYIMLLNNDTEVREDFLDRITANIDKNSIVTPRINYYSNSDKNMPWYCAGEIDYHRGIVKNGDPLYEGEVSFASGCCMLFSEEVFKTLGGLDERYFMYYESIILFYSYTQ